jgi:hypothetical protein
LNGDAPPAASLGLSAAVCSGTRIGADRGISDI